MGPRDDISEENRRRHETERQLALQHLAPFIEGLPEGELARPYLSYGSQMFTLRRIFSEIQGDTEYGQIFIEMLSAHRLELAKRAEEFEHD